MPRASCNESGVSRTNRSPELTLAPRAVEEVATRGEHAGGEWEPAGGCERAGDPGGSIRSVGTPAREA